jgi:hypothetical protein
MTNFDTPEEIQSLRQQGQIVTIPGTDNEVFLIGAGRKNRKLGILDFEGKIKRIAKG